MNFFFFFFLLLPRTFGVVKDYFTNCWNVGMLELEILKGFFFFFFPEFNTPSLFPIHMWKQAWDLDHNLVS